MRVFVVLWVGLLACKSAQPEARRVIPPSEQEAEAFAKELVTHLAPCNTSALDRRIDDDLLIARSFANRRVSNEEVTGFKRGFGGVGQLLCGQLASTPNVTASYLRVQTIDGTPRPLVRLIMDGGLNYLELELDKRAGTVKVADIMIYMAGERLSDNLGQVIDQLRGASGDLNKISATMNRVNAHILAKEWPQAQTAFRTLPPKLRTSKPMRLVEIQIASELGNDAYLAAMDSYAKAFPGDPSLALVQIDHAFLREQYDAALRAIDQLDRKVGGDPYLDVLRADALRAHGKPAEALEAATRATTAAPDLVAAWWQLLTQQAVSERYADALPTLEVLRDKFGQDVSADTLRTDERFRALADSAELAAWSAR